MSDSPKPPVLWGTVILRWAMGVLLLVVLVIALRPGLVSWLNSKKKFNTSGDGADIRLVGVAPDGGNELFDAEGKLIPNAKLDWPGERTYQWGAQMMQRDFLFELGPGAKDIVFAQNNVITVAPSGSRGWPSMLSLGEVRERGRTPSGGVGVLVRLSVGTNYHVRSFFPGPARQQMLDVVDVNLSFMEPTRGPAFLTFKGPFAEGVTNVPENKTSSRVTVAPASGGAGAGRLVQVWDTRMSPYWQGAFFFDGQGRRYAARLRSMVSGGMGYTNQFELPEFPLTNLAYITMGENPRMKTFHNVALTYAGRPVRAYPAVLDELAAAIGRTNIPASSLMHNSPRSLAEAVTMLEFLPDHQSAMSYVAYSGRTTNFAELTEQQREKLRALARAWADRSDEQRRLQGLRVGLRGGWPEFTALGLTWLREGTVRDQSSAAEGFASNPKRLGEENIPLVLGLARSNASPSVGGQMVSLLGSFGRPADDALRELTAAEETWLWWTAIGYLPPDRLRPPEEWSGELQQRFWMVRDSKKGFITPENEAAARVRLAGMLTPTNCARMHSVFASAAQRAAVKLERGVAMEAYAKYLRAAGNEQLRYYPPSTMIQRINEWYGKDFGSLGDGKKGGQYPAGEEYPGIVEDVLEFYDKLKREGKVEAGK